MDTAIRQPNVKRIRVCGATGRAKMEWREYCNKCKFHYPLGSTTCVNDNPKSLTYHCKTCLSQ